MRIPILKVTSPFRHIGRPVVSSRGLQRRARTSKIRGTVRSWREGALFARSALRLIEVSMCAPVAESGHRPDLIPPLMWQACGVGFRERFFREGSMLAEGRMIRRSPWRKGHSCHGRESSKVGSGGRMRILAAIQTPAAIQAILEHLGLPSRAPPIAIARRPPRDSGNGTFPEQPEV